MILGTNGLMKCGLTQWSPTGMWKLHLSSEPTLTGDSHVADKQLYSKCLKMFSKLLEVKQNGMFMLSYAYVDFILTGRVITTYKSTV